MGIVKPSAFLLLPTFTMWVTVLSFSHPKGTYQSIGKRFVLAFPTIRDLPENSLAAITVSTGKLRSVNFYIIAPLIKPPHKTFGVTSRDFPFDGLIPASYRHTSSGLMKKGVLLIANDFVTVWAHIYRNSLYKNMFLVLPAVTLGTVYTFPVFGVDISEAATNPSLLIIGIELNSTVEVSLQGESDESKSWKFQYGRHVLTPGESITFDLTMYETFLIVNQEANVDSVICRVKSDKYVGVLQLVGDGHKNSSTSIQAVSFMYPDVTAGKMYVIPHTANIHKVYIVAVSLEDNTVINIIGLTSVYILSRAFDSKNIPIDTPEVPTVLNASDFFVANVLMTSLQEEVAMTPAISTTLFPQFVSFTIPKEVNMSAYIVFNKSAVMFLQLDGEPAASKTDLKTGKDYIGISRVLNSGFHLLYRHGNGMPFFVYLVTVDFLSVMPANMLLSKVRSTCEESNSKHDADTVDNDCDGEVDEDGLPMEGDDRSLRPVLLGQWSMWSVLTCSSICNVKGKWQRTRRCQDLKTLVQNTHYICIGLGAIRERNECDFSTNTCPLNCVAGFYGHNCSQRCPVGCAAKDCHKLTGNCYGCSDVLTTGAKCGVVKIEGYVIFFVIPVALFLAINAKFIWTSIFMPCTACIKLAYSKKLIKKKKKPTSATKVSH